MSNTDALSRAPTADPAEENAWFPSPYSLSQYVAPKTDFDGADYPSPHRGGKKILMVATDERYVLMKNGTMFSSGNHPVETMLPMMHLDSAGFEIEVTTLSGNPVKFEMWAMPSEDVAVRDFHARYLPKFKQPKKLADVLAGGLDDYVAVLVPGGHGALNGLPDSADLAQALNWAMQNDRYVITLCHGPAGLLAPAMTGDAADYPFKGYSICVFPDSLDEGANVDIGYIPGHLRWLLAESLEKLGVTVLNEGITGQVHRDRKLLTGDSPLASNALGRLAAETLLKDFGA
ncbi:MAG: protein deglycase HchA [Paracoccus sp.]|nr:protein deglycase HchA [Paracoccus sp. (in: a-proteobacteria)]